MRGAILVILFWAASGLWGQPVEVNFDQAYVGFTPGTQMLHLQLAQTIAQHERGLMQRTTVAPYDGMLFIFNKPQQVAFWMKDTLIPLEVGYFDSTGTLQEIHPLKPQDTTPVASTIAVLYALELPAGDFEKHDLRLGCQITGIAQDKRR